MEMNSISRSQSQITALKPLFPVTPLLSVTSSEFEQIWKEVKWDTKRVNATLDLFSTFCKENLDLEDNKDNTQLMSNVRLMAVLKSIAIIGTEINDLKNSEFFSKNDLCTIMTGIPFIDKKSFLRLMCLLDRSTPHTTTSPAGICRLKLVFAYYDWGWKGYLDEFDWKRLRSDIINFTYYGKLYNKNKQELKSNNNVKDKNDPMPETLDEGLKRLGQEISMKSLNNMNNGSQFSASRIRAKDNIQIMNNLDHLNDNEEFKSINSNINSSQKLIIDFPLFIKLVEYRIIKGTSQILRIEIPTKEQEEFINYSIKYNGGSIFMDNFRNNTNNSPEKSKLSNLKPILESQLSMKNSPNSNSDSGGIDIIDKNNKQILSDQIQELDNELNHLRMSLKNNSNTDSLKFDVAHLNNNIDHHSRSITISENDHHNIESIFGPPEDLNGIFCDKPNYSDNQCLSSIVIPTSSTPIRKSRSNRSNILPKSPNTDNNLVLSSDDHSKIHSKDKIPSNDLDNSNIEIGSGGPPILI